MVSPPTSVGATGLAQTPSSSEMRRIHNPIFQPDVGCGADCPAMFESQGRDRLAIIKELEQVVKEHGSGSGLVEVPVQLLQSSISNLQKSFKEIEYYMRELANATHDSRCVERPSAWAQREIKYKSDLSEKQMEIDELKAQLDAMLASGNGTAGYEARYSFDRSFLSSIDTSPKPPPTPTPHLSSPPMVGSAHSQDRALEIARDAVRHMVAPSRDAGYVTQLRRRSALLEETPDKLAQKVTRQSTQSSTADASHFAAGSPTANLRSQSMFNPSTSLTSPHPSKSRIPSALSPAPSSHTSSHVTTPHGRVITTPQASSASARILNTPQASSASGLRSSSMTYAKLASNRQSFTGPSASKQQQGASNILSVMGSSASEHQQDVLNRVSASGNSSSKDQQGVSNRVPASGPSASEHQQSASKIPSVIGTSASLHQQDSNMEQRPSELLLSPEASEMLSGSLLALAGVSDHTRCLLLDMLHRGTAQSTNTTNTNSSNNSTSTTTTNSKVSPPSSIPACSLTDLSAASRSSSPFNSATHADAVVGGKPPTASVGAESALREPGGIMERGGRCLKRDMEVALLELCHNLVAHQVTMNQLRCQVERLDNQKSDLAVGMSGQSSSPKLKSSNASIKSSSQAGKQASSKSPKLFSLSELASRHNQRVAERKGYGLVEDVDEGTGWDTAQSAELVRVESERKRGGGSSSSSSSKRSWGAWMRSGSSITKQC